MLVYPEIFFVLFRYHEVVYQEPVWTDYDLCKANWSCKSNIALQFTSEEIEVDEIIQLLISTECTKDRLNLDQCDYHFPRF